MKSLHFDYSKSSNFIKKYEIENIIPMAKVAKKC